MEKTPPNLLILTSSNNFVVADWVKHLPKKPTQLRLTFIPTAAEVEKGSKQWLKDDRQALVAAGFPVNDFTLTGKTIEQVQQQLAQTDLVFVAGGNTFYLLQEMQKSGFIRLIRHFVKEGGIYAGSSAGSIVAGPSLDLVEYLDNPKLAPDLVDRAGLALTDTTVFPHWGSPIFHNRYGKLMKAGYQKGHQIILLTDDQYLLVRGNEYKIYSI